MPPARFGPRGRGRARAVRGVELAMDESKRDRLLWELRSAANHVWAAGQVALEAAWQPVSDLVERTGVPDAMLRLAPRIIAAARRCLGFRERPQIVRLVPRPSAPSRDEFEALARRVAALEQRPSI